MGQRENNDAHIRPVIASKYFQDNYYIQAKIKRCNLNSVQERGYIMDKFFTVLKENGLIMNFVFFCVCFLIIGAGLAEVTK